MERVSSFVAHQCNVLKSILVISLLLTFSDIIAQTGEVLDFDGINNSVTIPVPLSGNYTKEAWIKPSSTANFPNIISGNNTALFIENGKLTAGHAGTFTYKEVQDAQNLIPGNWYHIAVTYDASNTEMKLYKNGILVATNAGASPYTEPFLNLSLFLNSNRYTGQMDEVRIWKTARTSTEINNSMNCELTGDEPGLLAYYNFNQGVAGGNNTDILSLRDNSDKCNATNGTLNNFVLTGSTSNFLGAGPALSGTCVNNFANIAVKGNGLCIPPGAGTTSAADNTSFGNFTTTPITKTYLIENTGNALLTLNGIQVTGSNASDFTVVTGPPATIAPGGSASFSVGFSGSGSSGLKTAILQVNSDDADEQQYSFAVDGIKSEAAKSLDFDGVNDDISLPFVISGDYTKEAWIKTNTLSNFPNILSGTGTALFLNNGRVAAGHSVGGFGQALGSTVLTTNQWHHLAVSYNSSTQVMKLYLNGALQVTATAVPAYNETVLKIGSLNGSNFFWGKIDQVRIWKVARTDAEIQNSSQCNISGDEPGLLAWYNFNQGAGEGMNAGLTSLVNEVDNCSSSASNGTLQNFALSGNTSNWVSESNNILNNCTAAFPNIKVAGNGICIADGTNTTTTSNSTDFGNVDANGSARTFVIYNTGGTTLNIGSINFSGTDNSMFSVESTPSASIAAGDSSSIIINFLPQGTGLKTANLIINNDDPDESSYTFALQGTGINAPISITAVSIIANANGTASVSWVTNVPATSGIAYGINAGSLNTASNDPLLVTNHSIQLTGLDAGISYYFRITSVDAVNNSASFPNPPAAPDSFAMPPAINLQPQSQAICAGATVNLSSAATSSVASTVQWQISVDNGVSWSDSIGATAASVSFAASAADNNKMFRAIWTNSAGLNISATATLTVNLPTAGTETTAICSSLLPYNWNGVDYTESGSYSIVLPAANANGCDSTATLNLMVKDTSFSITNISICNNLLPYNWNGVDYNASGSYTIVLPAANGCDSTATLNLTVKDSSFSITNVSICNNLLPYNWNGVEYNTSGSYTIVLPA
ncbi:MAG: LamG domain-containing protein, partial [Chitinophagaceae bacterium]